MKKSYNYIVICGCGRVRKTNGQWVSKGSGESVKRAHFGFVRMWRYCPHCSETYQDHMTTNTIPQTA